MSRVLQLFERAAQSLSAEEGGASSSRLDTTEGGGISSRRLDFGPSPSLEPPTPSFEPTPSATSSRHSARNVPRGLKTQPDSRLDHHRAAVLGQRLLVAELRGCERQAALVPELMQLVEEASRVSLSSSLAHAASQPELQMVMRVMQLELQAVELRHCPLPEELAERYETQAHAHAQAVHEMEQARCEMEQAHAQAFKDEREASALQALQAEQQVAELGEELGRLAGEHEAVLEELLLRGKCDAASARASALQLEARLELEQRSALELARGRGPPRRARRPDGCRRSRGR